MSGISDAQRIAISYGLGEYVNAKVCNHCAGRGQTYNEMMHDDANCFECKGTGYINTKDITNGHI